MSITENNTTNNKGYLDSNDLIELIKENKKDSLIGKKVRLVDLVSRHERGKWSKYTPITIYYEPSEGLLIDYGLREDKIFFAKILLKTGELHNSLIDASKSVTRVYYNKGIQVIEND